MSADAVIILAFQNGTLDRKHGLFERVGSLGVHMLAKHLGLDPFRPYNSIKSVSQLRLNETFGTV